MNEEKIKEILDTYKETILKIEEALALAGVPSNLIPIYTIYFPQFQRMLPEDAIKIFKNLRELLIIYLRELGFTHREIARRIGGSGTTTVFEILKKYNMLESEIKLGSMEAVIKKEDIHAESDASR